jgi:flagellar basal-body rod protein FlgG
MLRSLFTAATGMEAQALRMDVISNNLANVSTTGFKKVRAEFEDLLSETITSATAPDPNGGGIPAPFQVGLGVRTGGTTRSFSQGDMIATNNSLDVAIEGAGFFQIQRPSGALAYTRAGNFRVDATGRMVTQHGEIVEPGIHFPQETTSIAIKPDGSVWATVAGKADAAEVGSIELHVFPNPAGLEALGGNLFAETTGSGSPQGAKPGLQGTGALLQGYLEGANVKAVEEMIDMIATQRAYELNSKVIQSADQMLQRLTNIR